MNEMPPKVFGRKDVSFVGVVHNSTYTPAGERP